MLFRWSLSLILNTASCKSQSYIAKAAPAPIRRLFAISRGKKILRPILHGLFQHLLVHLDLQYKPRSEHVECTDGWDFWCPAVMGYCYVKIKTNHSMKRTYRIVLASEEKQQLKDAKFESRGSSKSFILEEALIGGHLWNTWVTLVSIKNIRSTQLMLLCPSQIALTSIALIVAANLFLPPFTFHLPLSLRFPPSIALAVQSLVDGKTFLGKS